MALTRRPRQMWFHSMPIPECISLTQCAHFKIMTLTWKCRSTLFNWENNWFWPQFNGRSKAKTQFDLNTQRTIYQTLICWRNLVLIFWQRCVHLSYNLAYFMWPLAKSRAGWIRTFLFFFFDQLSISFLFWCFFAQCTQTFSLGPGYDPAEFMICL